MAAIEPAAALTDEAHRRAGAGDRPAACVYDDVELSGTRRPHSIPSVGALRDRSEDPPARAPPGGVGRVW
ncbi:hypothetical protein ADK67_27805 [Saccharothrix sp. NRRL B-16348]|uniref:hypothetical protein n=1 Tax=Saccharothrix sp. NRRL B-16348 TaxID=1415542 RepID=UPI0006B0667A|nr:hypothetical protein [Saccharothrix sp. NRRL B-16348]KOX21251.1 hypothetical protein ADK67_27805 [Saccharothrix sp. NRRL B-16348]